MDAQGKAAPSPREPILLGCGGLLILVLMGTGVCAVFLYLGEQKAAEISAVGAEYLKSEPRVIRALGTIREVGRERMGEMVGTANGHGKAYFRYTLRGDRGSGMAEVWLGHEPEAPWRAVGAVVRPSLQQSNDKPMLIRIGTPGDSPSERTKLSD